MPKLIHGPNPEVLASVQINNEFAVVYKNMTDAEKIEGLLKIIDILVRKDIEKLWTERETQIQ
jgi:hypothetical protein